MAGKPMAREPAPGEAMAGELAPRRAGEAVVTGLMPSGAGEAVAGKSSTMRRAGKSMTCKAPMPGGSMTSAPVPTTTGAPRGASSNGAQEGDGRKRQEDTSHHGFPPDRYPSNAARRLADYLIL